jgi:hypothetical protein
MTSNEAKEESEGMQPSDVANQWEEEETLDSVSSGEDVSSTSNSDEDSPKIRLKIRRTVSEPVMMRADDVEVLQEETQAEVSHQDTTEISELMTECSIEEATLVPEGQKSASEGEHFSSFMHIILKLFFN